MRTCAACEGKGTVVCVCPQCDVKHQRKCTACRGAGKVLAQPLVVPSPSREERIAAAFNTTAKTPKK